MTLHAWQALQLATAADGGSILQPALEWFHLDDPSKRLLIAFGLLGQVVFFSRWIIQWVASERRRESHVPELFWWCSLIGALMLVVYFVLEGDVVGTLGQAVGWTVYSRNLYLIHRKRRAQAVR